LKPFINKPKNTANKLPYSKTKAAKEPDRPLLTCKDKRIKELELELEKLHRETNSVIEKGNKERQELQLANENLASINMEFQLRNNLLEELHEYSEAIISTIQEPMLVLNEKLEIKSANRAFYKKFHTINKNIEGHSLFELDNEQWNIPKLRKLLEDVACKGISVEDFELKGMFPFIGEKVLLLNSHRIIQRTHKEQLILLAIRDITERSKTYLKEKELLRKDILLHKEDKLELEKAVKRRTRQLEQKNRELERANKDLTSFTYISSHDLQEPLRKIQNFITIILLEEEKNLSKSGKQYFSRVKEIAQRMQKLIEDLLKYCRTKDADQAFEPANITLILEEVKKDFKETLHEKQAKILVKPLGHAPVISFQFRQLFHNLISNSLKFSKPGVRPLITIYVRPVSSKEYKLLKLVPAKKYLHIIYSDNGIGFNPKYKDRIFEVFQRLHSVDEYKGTGIGLAICKRIVENHKGIITADGQPGKGARFDIYIPVD
jgi:two-component system, chemotaxis family, CheB/CheR fusion protein